MQIKKRNRRTARRSLRKSHRKAHSRNNCRSTRRRMGGAHMTVYQPYKYDSHDDFHSEFDIEINPNIEEMYNHILNHRYNHYTEKMAPTFADQQMGQGDYVVVFNDDEPSATIQSRNLEDRLAAL